MALGWYLMHRFELSYRMSNYLFQSFCDIECTIMFVGCRSTSLGSINAVDIVYARIMIVRRM